MKKIISIILCLMIIGCCLCGCAKQTQKDEQLLIYTSHPVNFLSSLIENFENETGIFVSVKRAGTGEILQMIETSKGNPPCDVLWGGSYATVAPKQYLFEQYLSVNEQFVQENFKNVEGTLTRFSDIPSVLMINKKMLGEIEIKGYYDLLNPLLKGKIAFCDPNKSSSALEHLINMLYATGKGDFEVGWQYVKDFCANLDGTLLSGSVDVYKGVSEGKFAVGLTFEEGGASYAVVDDNIQLVYMEEGVVSTPDGVYIVKNAQNMTNAQKFIDYITGKNAQTYMALNLNRRSVRVDVDTASYMMPKTKIKIIKVDYEFVGQNKEIWLDHFTDIYEEVGR